MDFAKYMNKVNPKFNGKCNKFDNLQDFTRFYFDPYDKLTDNFLTYNFEEIHQILKGDTKPDTLKIIPK